MTREYLNPDTGEVISIGDEFIEITPFIDFIFYKKNTKTLQGSTYSRLNINKLIETGDYVIVWQRNKEPS